MVVVQRVCLCVRRALRKYSSWVTVLSVRVSYGRYGSDSNETFCERSQPLFAASIVSHASAQNIYAATCVEHTRN